MIVNGNIINNNGLLSRRSPSRHHSSSSNSKSFREWSILVGLILVLPMSVTYFHLNQLLRYERCAINRYSPYQQTPNLHDNYNSTTSTTSSSSPLDGIYCKVQHRHDQQQQQAYYFIPTGKHFGDAAAPPSIVKLVTTIIDEAAQQQNAVVKLPLSSPSTTTTTAETTLPVLLYHYDYSLAAAAAAAAVVEPETTVISSTKTATGFRKNPNKSSTTATSTKIIPITTYFWLLLNIGLYILYWNNRITPSNVALNGKIIATIGTTRTTSTRTTTNNKKKVFGDFSRGITGNLAHFDIWHIGMNMMTLLQVGEILEISLGTIPLFLWTCSFLGYTTICAILLYYIKEQITQRLVRGGNNSTTSPTRTKSITKFPNMVGFSGILFCWSTFMTLSLDKNQQICPIPMLTQVCFQTYELTTNGFKFNWGPIVQLVLLQFILKNVSFIGHLSGIIIGFLWYWNILPSLELSQPSILFPLIWFFGKYYLFYTTSTRNDDEMTNMNDRNDDYDYDTERGRGHVLGGQGQVKGISSSSSSSSGYVLGSSKNNNNSNNHNDHHHHHHQQQQQQQGRLSSSSFLTLRFIRNCFVLHLILSTWVYAQNQKEEEIVPLLLLLRRVLELYYSNSIIISELLMIILLSLLVRAMTFTQSLAPNVSNNGNDNNNNNNPFKSIGLLGRGFIALCTVTFVTDSMTLGGWFATRGLWSSSSSTWTSSSSWTIALFIFIIRLILWIVSISIVCHILDCNNEIQDGRRNHCSSISDSNSIVVGISDIVDDGDDGDEDDRIWFQIFGSFLINPCRTLGKVLTENRVLSSSSTTAAAVGGLAMTTTATSTSSSSTSRGGTRSSNSISERRANILSSRGGGGGGGNKSTSTVTKVVEDV